VRISFIVPTTGERPSLAAALQSIETLPGDEILVVGPVPFLPDSRARGISCKSAHDWGATERELGIAHARGDFLAFMDDDDVYAPNHRAVMEAAMYDAPDTPTLFRMRYPDGHVLWGDPALVCGNVSTQMMLVPNDTEHLGSWKSGRRECDFDFLASSKWRGNAITWRTDVICHRSEEKYQP